MNVEIGQIISQVFAFLIVYWILKRYAWHPFLSHLEQRREKIQGEFDEIEEQKRQLAERELAAKRRDEEWEKECRKQLEESLHKGITRAKEIEHQAKDQAAEIIRLAEKRAEHAISAKVRETQKEMVQIATAMAKRVAKVGVGKAEQEALYKEWFDGKG